jgi:superfamily II DNA/RNA helicase
MSENYNSNNSSTASLLLHNETFAERYGDAIPPWLVDGTTKAGYLHPTETQRCALDAILVDRRSDVIVQAETGSGKTLAYLLPTLAGIDPCRSSLQAIVVVPTRELGLQVSRVARRLASSYRPSSSSTTRSEEGGHHRSRILVMSVLQGSQNRRQRAWAWAEPPHIVIGTPVELLGMVRKGGFRRYNSVRTLVVDEVDACLLNNVGSVYDASSSSSSSSPLCSPTLLQSSTLHELLSKFLSPTYSDAGSADTKGTEASPLENLRRRSRSSSASTSSIFSSSIMPTNTRPVSHKRTTIFCSATIPQPRHFLRQCVQNRWTLGNPKHLRVMPSSSSPQHPPSGGSLSSGSMVPTALEHGYFVCSSPDRKFGTLRRILTRLCDASLSSTPKKVIVFCDPRRPMAEMARILSRDLSIGRDPNGISMANSDPTDDDGLRDRIKDRQARAPIVSVLSLDDSLSQRAIALNSFRGLSEAAATARRGSSVSSTSQQTLSTTASPGNRGMRVLLSTDLAARGLDIVDITHVIHYDVPVNADTVSFPFCTTSASVRLKGV